MSSGKWRSFCLGLNVLKSILVGSAVYLMVVIRQDMLNTLVPVRIANGFCVSYQQLFALADQVVDWFTYGPKPCNYRDLECPRKTENIGYQHHSPGCVNDICESVCIFVYNLYMDEMMWIVSTIEIHDKINQLVLLDLASKLCI